MPIDYRSPLDEQNAKNFGFGNVIDQANSLADFLKQKQQFQQAQNLKQVLQSQHEKAQTALEAQRQVGEYERQQAGFGQQKEMLPLQEQSKEKLSSFESAQTEEKQQRDLQRAVDTANTINKGRGPLGTKASVSIGGTKIEEGAPSMTQYYGQMGREAKTVQTSTAKSLQPFQDQANAAKNTLDNLDLGTPQAFKLGLISEAKLAAGAGGSRALKSIIDVVTGGKTANQSFGDALNYLNNTQDLTVPPAAIQNLREAVLNRVSQIQPNYQKVKEQISKGIPQLAPMSASMGQDKGLVDNAFGPIDSTFGELNKRNLDYMKSKTNQGQPGGLPPQAPYQQPQSNLDKLRAFFRPKQPPQQGVAPQTSGIVPPSNVQPGTLKVRHKASGQTGTIPSNEMSDDYEAIQ